MLLNAVNFVRRHFAPKRISFYAPGATEADRDELAGRARFYFGDEVPIRYQRSRLPTWLLFHGPLLLFCPRGGPQPLLPSRALGVFDVNFRTSPIEAWAWFEAEAYLNGAPDRSAAKASYDAWKSKVTSLNLNKVYAFGTGPSLASAISREWSDGIRIVCNTIVRDPELWRHIAPHAVVAADALYHFGPTEFARAFRADLLLRLRESPGVVFIYPDIFHSLVVRDVPIEPHRLIPIRKGGSQSVHTCLADDFTLPGLGNILNLMLLPIGCDLSKHVKLWGFDGRAPSDTLFWANSSKHSYPELMGSLQVAHPAFFDHFVPKEDPEAYVRAVHGDVLEYCLSQAEKYGWTFEMLHRSWTQTLERRRTVNSDGAAE
jgi:hypothetical protein